ncbi:hypothetical protein DFH06DRAFT_1235184 [Mycena polygramma]|nr:hypothetical protein DFH06DRAFT_1235184 [Mycena polygramma]
MFTLLLLVGSSLLLTAPSVAGQQPSVLWRKPNITTSTADRITIAGAAIEKGLNNIGADGQFDGADYSIAGDFYYQMADFDIAVSGTQYRNALQQYFILAQNGRSNFTDPISYGYAAARAYTAYKDPLFLEYAVESWWFGRGYTISQVNADTGKIGGKNFSISSACQGATMVGGTFYSIDAAETAINGLPTGLSALLAEATSDPMYLQAAQESTAFMSSQFFNTQNIALDGISGRANDSCVVSPILEPYNSGLMIESLAILASVTQSNSTQTLLATTVQAAIAANAWQGSNGIISNGGHGGGGDICLVRGLGAAYSRNQTNATLHSYIQSYLAVQFNAILDQSTSGNDDIYGGRWIGPPSSNFSGAAQTNALSGLVTAISLQNATDPSSSSATPQPSSSTVTDSSTPSATTSGSHTSVGAIVGGVIGALFLLAACLAIWILAERRRRTDTHSSAPDPPTSTQSTINPFFVPTPPSTTTSKRSPVGLSPISRHRHRKGVQNQNLNAAPRTESTALTRITTPRTESSPAVLGTMSSEARVSSTMPTAELVRLLNRRLQNHEWDEDEAPPEYPAPPNGRGDS